MTKYIDVQIENEITKYSCVYIMYISINACMYMLFILIADVAKSLQKTILGAIQRYSSLVFGSVGSLNINDCNVSLNFTTDLNGYESNNRLYRIM